MTDAPKPTKRQIATDRMRRWREKNPERNRLVHVRRDERERAGVVFTKKPAGPCRRCGSTERHPSDGSCIPCTRARNRDYHRRKAASKAASPSVLVTSARPCAQCGTCERYRSCGNCHRCAVEQVRSRTAERRAVRLKWLFIALDNEAELAP